MRPDRLAEIAETLKRLRKITKGVLAFEALWAGEKPTEEKEVSMEEMVRIIYEGRIGTKTRYLVR